MAIDFSSVDFGVVTATPIEYAALLHLLEQKHERSSALPNDHSMYLVGELPSLQAGRSHTIALALLAQDGTRTAAATCTSLLDGFPTIRTVFMIGIAGGVPAVDDAHRHVRLGDIVVATEIIDYGHLRAEPGGIRRLRVGPDGPSAEMAFAERILQAREAGGERSWEAWLGAGREPLPDEFARPGDETDIVYVDDIPTAHPDDRALGRRHGFPRVHRGIVASGDILVRDAVVRERIAGEYGARAVEMEAAGIAAAAKLRSVPWFMIRGIVDYCDDHKNDLWHPYASLAAAAYLRALLAKCRPAGGSGTGSGSGTVDLRPGGEVAQRPISGRGPTILPRPDPIRYLTVIVDAILQVRELLDNASRRLLISLLPPNIQMAIPEQPNPRLQVISIVRTCNSFRGGQEALLQALRMCVPDGSLEREHAELTIVTYWHGISDY